MSKAKSVNARVSVFQAMCTRIVLPIRGILASAIFVSIFAPAVYADVTPRIDELIAISQQQRLSENPTWLALLHYHQDTDGRWRSPVKDGNFFLAGHGATNPRAELEATLNIFFSNGSNSRAAQCRFVARYRWLIQQLNLAREPDDMRSCVEYSQWRNSVNAGTAVVVFPSAYLNAPSSMFGHTLLRLDPPAQSRASALLSLAVNFAADVPAEDANSVAYLYKGLAGGFPGRFYALPYYETLRKYQRLENRDIWEYTLNFNTEEMNRLTDHVWELLGVDFDYYFIDENCSYRLVELLEAARPSSMRLSDHFNGMAIPIDTVRLLFDAGYISKVDYRPSNAKELLSEIARLPPSQKSIAQSLVSGGVALEAEDLRNLSEVEQALTVRAAYRYLQYVVTTERDHDPNWSARSYGFLQRLRELPAPALHNPAISSAAPDSGHRSARHNIGIGRDDARGYAQLGYRGAYHDLIDNTSGYDPGAEIVFMNVALRATETTLSLNKLDLLGIRSLTPRDDFFHPISWQLDAALERDPLFDRTYFDAHARGGIGVTYAPADTLWFFALATMRIEHNSGFDTDVDIAPGVSTGLYWRIHMGAGELNVDTRRLIRNDIERHAYSLNQNIELGVNLALRLGAQCDYARGDHSCDIHLDLAHYF